MHRAAKNLPSQEAERQLRRFHFLWVSHPPTDRRGGFSFQPADPAPDGRMPRALAPTAVTVASGNGALWLNGNPISAPMPFVINASRPVTVEMYYTSWNARLASGFLLIADKAISLKQFEGRISWTGYRQFGEDKETRIDWMSVSMPSVPKLGERIHLAGVSTGDDLRLFVNGKLMMTKRLPQRISPSRLEVSPAPVLKRRPARLPARRRAGRNPHFFRCPLHGGFRPIVALRDGRKYPGALSLR